MYLHSRVSSLCSPFFFNDTAPTEIYTLSLHDALPIFRRVAEIVGQPRAVRRATAPVPGERSEEHTSELQSLTNLVCRLLLEKKKDTDIMISLFRALAHAQAAIIQAIGMAMDNTYTTVA